LPQGLRVDQAKRFKDLECENARLKKLAARQALDNAILQGDRLGKLLSPVRRRQAVTHVRAVLDIPERRACRVLAQPRGVSAGALPACRPSQKSTLSTNRDGRHRLPHRPLVLRF
jgi:hypothetical protein